MSLADEIEAGGGTDEAVALALGFYTVTKPWAGIEIFDGWRSPDEFSSWGSDEPPAFLTDLNALAAECERRDYSVRLLISPDGITKALVGDNIGSGDTPASALCAALVRAVQSATAPAADAA